MYHSFLPHELVFIQNSILIIGSGLEHYNNRNPAITVNIMETSWDSF